MVETVVATAPDPSVVAAAVTVAATTPVATTPANTAPAADAKVGDANPTPPADPNKVDGNKEPPKPVTVKAPDGIELPAETLFKFGELATKLGVTGEAAQEFVNWYAKEGQAKAQTQADTWKQVNDGWVAEAKADPEIGGDKFDTTVGNAKRAVAKFGDPKFVEALNLTGMGNHPAMIRFLNKVAVGFGEDKTLSAPGVSPASAASVADRLFPNQGK